MTPSWDREGKTPEGSSAHWAREAGSLVTAAPTPPRGPGLPPMRASATGHLRKQHQLFSDFSKKTEEETRVSNSFYKPSVTLKATRGEERAAGPPPQEQKFRNPQPRAPVFAPGPQQTQAAGVRGPEPGPFTLRKSLLLF